jgi:hypothetical protein
MLQEYLLYLVQSTPQLHMMSSSLQGMVDATRRPGAQSKYSLLMQKMLQTNEQ